MQYLQDMGNSFCLTAVCVGTIGSIRPISQITPSAYIYIDYKLGLLWCRIYTLIQSLPYELPQMYKQRVIARFYEPWDPT